MIVCSTPKIDGHYDFFTGLITLDKFSENELSLVNLAISNTPPPLNTEQAINLRNIRALVKHEITHFLDHTTTIWGLEFLYRRRRLVQALRDAGPDVKQRIDVYLLNLAELQMHSHLIKVHKHVSFNQCDTVKHNLLYDKRYGPIIIINFFQGHNLVCDVPLSMLSLLEANAIANEYLARFDDLVCMDIENKSIAEAVVERRLQKILNAAELSEYSVLIRLALIHFTFLDTRQILSYMSALASFCLNLSMYSLGAIIENIRHSFDNKEVGNGIWADLSRGMSRHVIAFKTILFMHAWINQAPVEKRQHLIAIMISTPYNAIEMFWKEHRWDDIIGIELGISLTLELFKKQNFNEELNIVEQALNRNTKWRQQKSLINLQFNEIACLDILLGDDTVISSPQRIDFDVLGHSYAVIDIYNEFDNLIADGIKKFHMPLQQASVMLETILTQKEAAQSKTRRAGS